MQRQWRYGKFSKETTLWVGGSSPPSCTCCVAPRAVLGTGEQTHQSIRRNFLEETYEALDAIDRNDTPGMCEELGDVLLQVVFHSVMEEEQGRFTADDVVDGVAQKLVFRHTHVFGAAEAADSAQALEGWEAQKKKEKGFTSRRTLWKPSPIRCRRCGGRRRSSPAL